MGRSNLTGGRHILWGNLNIGAIFLLLSGVISVVRGYEQSKSYWEESDC